jgi:hypothetical protein
MFCLDDDLQEKQQGGIEIVLRRLGDTPHVVGPLEDAVATPNSSNLVRLDEIEAQADDDAEGDPGSDWERLSQKESIVYLLKLLT